MSGHFTCVEKKSENKCPLHSHDYMSPYTLVHKSALNYDLQIGTTWYQTFLSVKKENEFWKMFIISKPGPYLFSTCPCYPLSVELSVQDDCISCSRSSRVPVHVFP
jgi:hypothetical protein